MPGRKFNTPTYRYGFNGKEADVEVSNSGDAIQDYGMRIYDPRLGRFLSTDPLTKQYPELTPYQFASNTPIWAVDLDGLEARYSTQKLENGQTKIIITIDLKVNNKANVPADFVQAYAVAIKAEIEKDFKGQSSDGKFVYETKVSINTNAKIDYENDFYIELTDNLVDDKISIYDVGVTDELGNTEKNRFQLLIDKKDFSTSKIKEDALTAAHEVGHGLGLTHESADSDVRNLMAQSVYTSTGSDITSEQLKIIHKTISDNAPKVPFKLVPSQKNIPWMPKNVNKTENQKGNSDKKGQPKARF